MTFAPGEADPVAAHAFLTNSYWSPGISVETVRKAMKHSLCCTVHHAAAQIAMARLLTDYATHAYVSDVYVLDDHRGQGIAKAMLAAVLAHPDLQGLKHWMLFTRDAHSLYERFGWKPLANPERAMLLEFPDAYA